MGPGSALENPGPGVEPGPLDVLISLLSSGHSRDVCFLQGDPGQPGEPGLTVRTTFRTTCQREEPYAHAMLMLTRALGRPPGGRLDDHQSEIYPKNLSKKKKITFNVFNRLKTLTSFISG